MKPFHEAKEIGEKNYQLLKQFLDFMIRTIDIAKDTGMLPIVLHQNNLRPMYKNWPHGEQARWWTHAEKFNILEQPA
jgi:hypothetical protein